MSVLLTIYYRKKVKREELSEKKGKRRYSILVFLIGLFSGTVLFISLMEIFHLNAGHGEVYFMLMLGNILLSLVLIVIGRILIAWKTIIY